MSQLQRKKKTKHNRTVLIGKDKLNAIEIINSKALIDWCISNDEFTSVNNILREYNEMKNEIKNPATSVEYVIAKQVKPIVSFVKNIMRTKIQILEKKDRINQCSYQTVMFVFRKKWFYETRFWLV